MILTPGAKIYIFHMKTNDTLFVLGENYNIHNRFLDIKTHIEIVLHEALIKQHIFK